MGQLEAGLLWLQTFAKSFLSAVGLTNLVSDLAPQPNGVAKDPKPGRDLRTRHRGARHDTAAHPRRPGRPADHRRQQTPLPVLQRKGTGVL